MHHKSVLLIGLDAAEVTLVERWIEEGHLPNLAAIRERGRHMHLASSAEYLVGSPWPTFYTSRRPVDHGLYHYLVWRPDSMTHTRPTPDWLPLRPFWRELSRDGVPVVALDVPQCYAPVEADRSVEVSGWATHELLEEPGSCPPALLDDICARHGKAPFDEEVTHALTAREILEVRDQCIETARKVGETGARLLREHPWDLGLMVFSSTHRGGHQLWGGGDLRENATADEQAALRGALLEVYRACDTAIGEIVDHAESHTDIMIFSLHGMGSNTTRVDVLREMLARVLKDSSSDGATVRDLRLADRLRALVPEGIRSRVKTRMPHRLQDRLTLYWRAADSGWEETPAFVQFGDGEGYVRINLAGREARGIVSRGEEFEQLCERIRTGLASFVDEDTGEAAVRRFSTPTDLCPERKADSNLPDIIVHWSDSPAANHRALTSPRYGRIPWPTPGRHPQGRPGNHRGEGFLLATGPSFEEPSPLERADIRDIAPTVYTLLGRVVPATFQGRSLVAAKRDR